MYEGGDVLQIINVFMLYWSAEGSNKMFACTSHKQWIWSTNMKYKVLSNIKMLDNVIVRSVNKYPPITASLISPTYHENAEDLLKYSAP